MSERTERIRESVCSEWQTTRQIMTQADYDGSSTSAYRVLQMMRKYNLAESRKNGDPSGLLEWRLVQ